MSSGGTGGQDREPHIGHDHRPITGEPGSEYREREVNWNRWNNQQPPRRSGILAELWKKIKKKLRRTF